MSSQSSFLADLAAEVVAQHRDHLHELTIVLPNGRAGGVLRQHLASHLSQPTWAPEVISIDHFLRQHSPLEQAPALQLTHVLYQTFQGLQPQEEPFERFYFWGSLLLQDLDVIDKYLVNAAHLFTDLSQQKAVSLAHDYLTEAQRTAIRAFWKNFEQRLSTHQKGFLRLWKLLPQVYEDFRTRLQQAGIGYQGLCYRAAYEALMKNTDQATRQPLVFAGFNSLTPVEEKILAWYQAHRSASFYWDVDAYYMEDEQQEAGTYLRAYQQRPHFQSSLARPFPERIAVPGKEVYVTAVASETGQAQVIGAQLQALMESQGTDFVPNKTAIIVANEALLLPVLHALPLDAAQVSTTMGYPLKDTSVYQLVEHLLTLQVAAAQETTPKGYLAAECVLAVLQHPYVLAWNPELAKATLHQFQATAGTYVSQAHFLQEDPWYALLFKPLSPEDSWAGYLVEVLEALQARATDLPLRSLEVKAVRQLLRQLDSLQALLGQNAIAGEDFVQLFRQLVQSTKLLLGSQVQGGLQVLDVLGTQNLDFDQVFIVGMNEGHFPVQANPSSFIPYNLRKGYGLPTADQHQAALYAYHFYRLLQRAQKVYITYSTAAAEGRSGEMSRYLWQLLYEAKLPLKKQVLTQSIYLTEAPPIVIPKNKPVLQQLQQWVVQPDGTAQSLSPSALNTYLTCRLRFYFQYLARLQTPPVPAQATDPLSFGNLLHETVEQLYTPLLRKDRPLQPQDLVALRKKVDATTQAVLARTFPRRSGAAVPGDQAIAQAVIARLVTRIVELDEAWAPFVLLGLELGRRTPLLLDFALGDGRQVRLRGIIDRVDWKEGVFRVLDYKTGTDSKQLKSIPGLFDREDPNRNKAAFQTFFYAWLFQEQGLAQVTVPAASGSGAPQVMPGLINTRQVFDDDFDPRFFIQRDGSRSYESIEAIAPYQTEWEAGLHQILTELLDPEVSFAQTDDATKCASCPYKGICQRH